MVCRFHRVPPEIVACAITGSSITYANVEQRGLDFLTYCMQRWITWWERKLGALQPSGQYVKFDLSPLLRTDILTRWVVNYAQITSRVMARSEVRAGEDLPPLTSAQLANLPARRVVVFRRHMPPVVAKAGKACLVGEFPQGPFTPQAISSSGQITDLFINDPNGAMVEVLFRE
jgi:hypothetical protein